MTGVMLLIVIAAAQDPFVSKGIEAAREAALQQGKIVVIDFFTTSSPECAKLNQTTWSNEQVRAWLRNNAISVRIDADKDRALATKHKVEAYPTILFLKADGTEIHRLVGYHSADVFLTEAASALVRKAEAKRDPKRARELVQQAIAADINLLPFRAEVENKDMESEGITTSSPIELLIGKDGQGSVRVGRAEDPDMTVVSDGTNLWWYMKAAPGLWSAVIYHDQGPIREAFRGPGGPIGIATEGPSAMLKEILGNVDLQYVQDVALDGIQCLRVWGPFRPDAEFPAGQWTPQEQIRLLIDPVTHRFVGCERYRENGKCIETTIYLSIIHNPPIPPDAFTLKAPEGVPIKRF